MDVGLDSEEVVSGDLFRVLYTGKAGRGPEGGGRGVRGSVDVMVVVELIACSCRGG